MVSLRLKINVLLQIFKSRIKTKMKIAFSIMNYILFSGLVFLQHNSLFKFFPFIIAVNCLLL